MRHLTRLLTAAFLAFGLIEAVPLGFAAAASSITPTRPPSFAFTFGGSQLASPHGIEIDRDDAVYVTNEYSNEVVKFSLTGTVLTHWGGQGSGPGQFAFPVDLAVGPGRMVYVADQGNDRVEQFTSQGQFVRQWGGPGSGNGQFFTPTAIATDRSGNVYVADNGNRRVEKFSAIGTYLSQWSVALPSDLAIDDSGNAYVSDGGTNTITKYSPDGQVLLSWTVPAGTLWGIALDPKRGFVYAVDLGNQVVIRLDLSGTVLTTWGGYGSGNGQFIEPLGIALANGGRTIYVTDSFNNRVEAFHLK